jgi:hypothetical protein
MTTEELYSQLSVIKDSAEFPFASEELVEHWEELQVGTEAIDAILHFMEENTDCDFGRPGPLVHFIEKFYQKGYEEPLVSSIRRVPTTHTLWMLNRIINGTKDAAIKDGYLQVLKNVIEKSKDEQILRTAQHFYGLHMSV